MAYKRIAIIGNRSLAKASKEVQCQAIDFVQQFVATHKPEWIVSGNAAGADQLSHLFNNNLQYLPWEGFNKHLMVNGNQVVAGEIKIFDEEILNMFPWVKTKPTLMKLIRRNFAMIRGIKPGNQVDAILYWTESAQVTGGTLYAYNLGKWKLGIPTFQINSNPTIDRFNKEYSFLSNFYPSKVKLDGETYPNVENAYQASKTMDEEVRAELALLNPIDAKRIGKKVKLRKDFDSIKVQIMFDLVKQKFQNAKLAKRLIETKESLLVEGNTWGDTFWGICNGVGENHLGKILMQVRKELK